MALISPQLATTLGVMLLLTCVLLAAIGVWTENDVKEAFIYPPNPYQELNHSRHWWLFPGYDCKHNLPSQPACASEARTATATTVRWKWSRNVDDLAACCVQTAGCGAFTSEGTMKSGNCSKTLAMAMMA